ncbi:MAG: DUF3857 domain-containing transglutaminase family protein [Hymenobacteraceae bacterium]|nr:DUF3857 domain-containing transglutaminase family protein [Hymenobacteraceae bacterium]MDX5397780.1 DUF3857 domain-containing transglutaminase family protein [Hymenobacteraceae bacterium]MDX5444337.1 DUF3857 domain-containing transglutaminase family protein [Hymenobacteraceae bacterium]MDX5513857.1 DUF3857 domain-containing transglutaminase family protein [Hymenobacteraceae bacterium]
MRSTKHSVLYALAIFVLTSFIATGKDKFAYPVTSIPEDLLKSDVVIRTDETVVNVLSDERFTLTEKHAFTILNESGNKAARLVFPYDSFKKIKVKKVKLYDGKGILIKSYSHKKFVDIGVSASNFTDDVRVLALDLTQIRYPYTIEYELESQVKGYLYLPSWNPVSNENISVMQSYFTVVAPSNLSIRYYQNNVNVELKQDVANEKTSYSWKLENYKATKKAEFALNDPGKDPYVLLAPLKFTLDGYTGTSGDWKSFGKFFYDINKGRYELDAKAQSEIKELVNGINDDYEKVQVLYKYLQNSCRYVSIQLGIGGWQTFKSEFVHQKKYGDCKALTYYMLAMLKTVGIKSYPVLIKAGQDAEGILTEFPSNQFNHVILALPMATDTVWLECTSSYLPVNYLSNFTQNRFGLWIDEAGGTLVKTPVEPATGNKVVTKAFVKIENNGGAAINSVVTYMGTFQDAFRELKSSSTAAIIEKYIHSLYSIPSLSVSAYDITDVEPGKPKVVCRYNLKVPAAAQLTESRLFVSPYFLPKKVDLAAYEPELYESLLRFPFELIDSIEVELPEGYHKLADLSSKTEVVSSDKAYFSSSVTELEKGKLLFVRKYRQSAAPTVGNGFLLDRDFFNTIYQADKAQVVLKKQE